MQLEEQAEALDASAVVPASRPSHGVLLLVVVDMMKLLLFSHMDHPPQGKFHDQGRISFAGNVSAHLTFADSYGLRRAALGESSAV